MEDTEATIFIYLFYFIEPFFKVDCKAGTYIKIAVHKKNAN